MFGGLKGLEHALDCDGTLTMGDVSLLFHHYLNTCPAQGSRTIRTEVGGACNSNLILHHNYVGGGFEETTLTEPEFEANM